MRAEDDLTYQEYKDGVHDCMIQYEKFGWTPRQVTDWMTEEDNEMGKYNDITPEERELLEKDIAFIRSKVELWKLKSYGD